MTALFDVKQVQERYKVCERTVFGWVKRGLLKGMKIGNKWQFSEKDLEAFEKKCKK